MSWLRRIALDICLKRALSKPCPNSIPRSGSEAKKVDCYACFVSETKNEPLFWLKSEIPQGFAALAWNKSIFDLDCIVLRKSIYESNITIRRSLGELDFKYTNTWDFVIYEFFGFAYFYLFLQRLRLLLFTLSTPHRQEAMKILKHMVDLRCRGVGRNQGGINPPGVTAIDLLIDLHGHLICSHPRWDNLYSYTKMVLESLESTEDIIQVSPGTYFAAGRSLDTIRRYEEENRRHRDIVIYNWIIAILTFILALIGGMQLYFQWHQFDAGLK